MGMARSEEGYVMRYDTQHLQSYLHRQGIQIAFAIAEGLLLDRTIDADLDKVIYLDVDGISIMISMGSLRYLQRSISHIEYARTYVSWH